MSVPLPSLRPPDALRLLDLGRREEGLAAARLGVEAARTPDELRPWAHVAEAAGHALLARAAWRRLLDLAPGDGEAAAALRELEPTPAPPPPRPDRAPSTQPTPSDLLRFCALFGGREGVVARMWSRGSEVGYSPVQVQLDETMARAHLAGEQTLGAYVIHRDDTVSYVVFDLDIKAANLERAWGDAAAIEGLRQRVHAGALQLQAALRAEGWAPLLVDSGFKGRHLWCFLQRRTPAAQARAAAHRALAASGLSDPTLGVEVFPKQDRVPQGGLGNLVKLPLGVHLRTQRRCSLLDEAGQPVADPYALLRSWPRTGLPTGPLPAAPPPTPLPAPPAVGAAPAPAFTAGDLDAQPRIAAVLSGCAVLRRVVDRVLDSGELERDAALVLEHSLGHLPEGVAAVNWLCQRAGLPTPMGRPHAGSPVSCARIRKRLPADVEVVPCDCRFSVPGAYDTPTLHAEGVAASPPTPAAPPIEQQLRALRSVEARIDALAAERDALRRHVVDRLAALPAGGFVVDGERWWVESPGGLPTLRRGATGGA